MASGPDGTAALRTGADSLPSLLLPLSASVWRVVTFTMRRQGGDELMWLVVVLDLCFGSADRLLR